MNRSIAFGVSCLVVLGACRGGERPAEAPAAAPTIGAAPEVAAPAAQQLALFAPLPQTMASTGNPATPERVALGRMLYYDTRLSKDQSVSCNSCHALDAYGVDHRPVSLGVGAHPGGRNAPTVYNAAGQIAQFWDGRAADVEEQAKGPILNPIEMAMPDSTVVLQRLHGVPAYEKAFAVAFPGEAHPITYDNVGKAIGAFERTLVTPSRWDRYLAGDHTALTADEVKGFETFVAVGCASCHNGAYVGGATFQRAGLVQPWPNREDLGRYAITKSEADRYVFKVPTLRNIDRTAPYFNDGKTDRLEEAVRMMGHYQLGRTLTDAQVFSIMSWLETLTGAIPADKIAPPVIPAAPSSMQ